MARFVVEEINYGMENANESSISATAAADSHFIARKAADAQMQPGLSAET